MSAPILRLSALQRPVFLLNSRSSLVTATPTEPGRYNPVLPGHPFSRSYGVNLPSSLTRVISRALVFSTCLPVSVCGTVRLLLARGFSRRMPSLLPFGFLLQSSTAGVLVPDGFAYPITPTIEHALPTVVLRNFIRVPPSLITLSPVLEYKPVVHHLPQLYTGLGLGPTKLKRTILP